MTREEARHKMEYSKRAYQMLIDEKVQEGVLVGQGINGEWSADTPIIDAYKDMLEACDMAIKALEQEPCEDCISRKALLEEVENGIKAGNYEEGYEEYPHINDMDDIVECIKYADRVQPKAEQEPKTGHWKTFIHNAYHGIDDDGEPIWREVKVYHCNLCNRRTVIKENYCPNCGARMESEG